MAIAVFRNPYTGTVMRVSGANISVLTAWGWERLDDGPAAPAYDPFPQYVTAAELTAALVGLGGGSGTADLTDTGYDLVLLLGQSNMQGGDGNGPISTVLDVTDPRVYSFAATGTYAGQIALASDPLAHRGGAGGVGPGMSFARWYAGTTPGNRRVLLVPAAYNGTAFGSGTPRWDPTTSWPNDSANLYNLAIAQAQAALTAAGPNARIAAVLWIQGESDALASLSGTTYRTFLEQLIDGLRSRLSLPNLPFVIGSMLPEFIAAGSTRQAIDTAHQAIPTRKRYTAYVAGPTGMGQADVLHYTPAGERELGRRLLAGLATAKANATPSSVVADAPPTAPGGGTPALTNTIAPAITGTATTGSTLTVSNGTWSATPDSYTRQWKRAGASISGATGSTYVLQVADEGQAITCTVTAVKSGYTSASATSNTVTPAAAGSPALTNSTLPTITGTATEGQTLTAGNGTWSATPDSYTYVWKRAGSAISGATASTYVLVTADVGNAITVTVTAIKSGYTSASATSAATATVAAAGSSAITASFNQADGPITTADTGQTLVSLGGQWRTVSNEAAPASATSTHTLLIADTSATNHSAQATMRTSGISHGVAVRVVDLSNFYVLLAGNAATQFYKMVAGSLSGIGTNAGTTNVGDVIKATVTGSTLTAYRNGVQIIQFTDTSLSVGTNAGLWANAATERMDDMVVAAL